MGSRDKTVESIFRTLYEFTLVSSGISGKLECQMIVVCHQISNEIVLSIWRQEIESLGKIVIERMLLLAEVNLQLFEFKILAWETIVASVVGTLLAYISLIMRSGIGRQDEPIGRVLRVEAAVEQVGPAGHGDVIVLSSRGNQQRLFYDILENLQRKIGVQRLLVDSNVTLTGFHVNASYSSFSASDGIYNFHTHYLISFNLIVLGD